MYIVLGLKEEMEPETYGSQMFSHDHFSSLLSDAGICADMRFSSLRTIC